MKKKMNNKGFTLVELIVVLVILAILAAILVPALLGYIDRAKKQQIVLNAKTFLTASQAELSAMYGAGKKSVTNAEIEKIRNTADIKNFTSFTGATAKAMGDDVEYDGSNHDAYTIVAAKYEEGDQIIYFANGSWDATESEYTAKATGTTFTVTPATSGD